MILLQRRFLKFGAIGMPTEECVSKCRDVRTTMRISHQTVEDIPEYAASCAADFRIRQRFTGAVGAILHQSLWWDSPSRDYCRAATCLVGSPQSHCWLFWADYGPKVSNLSVRPRPHFTVVSGHYIKAMCVGKAHRILEGKCNRCASRWRF